MFAFSAFYLAASAAFRYLTILRLDFIPVNAVDALYLPIYQSTGGLLFVVLIIVIPSGLGIIVVTVFRQAYTCQPNFSSFHRAPAQVCP